MQSPNKEKTATAQEGRELNLSLQCQDDCDSYNHIHKKKEKSFVSCLICMRAWKHACLHAELEIESLIRLHLGVKIAYGEMRVI